MDLDVPHFHHEIVYEAIQIALENGSEDAMTAVTNLLKHLSDASMITDEQMVAVGFPFQKHPSSTLILHV